MHRIVTILPKGEGFSSGQFGAIALCVRDFTRASRYKADTLVIGGIPSPGFSGVDYRAAPAPRWFENRTRSYAKWAAYLAREESAKLVEIHNRPKLVKLMGKARKAAFALHLHNDPQEMEGARSAAERIRLLAKLSGVYCVSEYIRGRFLEGLPQSAQAKLYTVYNGIEIPQALPEKEKQIVFAGRLTEGKGALLLAQALRIALPELPGWRAVMIGSRRHEAGRELTSHERQIHATLEPLGLQVEVTGFLPHETTLIHFARSSIAVIPSVWAEPFGRTAIEAMAYGCALISSGQGALREVTADAALTLPQLSAEALAHAIASLARDESLRDSYARLARERVAYFAIDARTKALDDARDLILRDAHAA